MDLILPYKIGDLVETKSFMVGFRGAWFRSKVNDMRVTESGHLECYLEYIDYPGEEKEWVQLFQTNPGCTVQESSDSNQIMIRPSFPQWYWKDQVPGQLPNNDVTATVYEAWKVGDLVDFLSEGCYWSAKITKLLDEDMVEVELPKPPIGEGNRYPANRNDLRPTLEWSLTKGWTVPLSRARRKSWYTAVLAHHKYESETSTSDEESQAGSDAKGEEDGEEVNKAEQQPETRASDIMSQGAPGSSIPTTPSPGTHRSSSLDAHQDGIILNSMESEELQPSSTPRHGGVQPAAVTWSYIKQEQEEDHENDDALRKLDAVEGKLRDLLERVRSGHYGASFSPLMHQVNEATY